MQKIYIALSGYIKNKEIGNWWAKLLKLEVII